jgi:hypothetical protein
MKQFLRLGKNQVGVVNVEKNTIIHMEDALRF